MGSTRTCVTDRQTDGADYIGPAVQRPAGRVQKELWVWVWKLWVTDWRLWYWICPRWNWTKYTMHSCERIENVNRYETGPNPDTRRPHPWLTTNVIPHYVDGRTKMLAWLRFSTKCRIPHFWYVFSSLLSDLGFLDRKRLSIFPYECFTSCSKSKRS